MLTSRDDLKQYALRNLGAPVVNINVDDQQLEDRIDEALEYWRLYHPEGTEEVYALYTITASRITITTNNGDAFVYANVITGSSSGANATITDEKNVLSSGNTLIVAQIVGEFEDGEQVTTPDGITATLASSNAVTKGIFDNKYIVLPDSMYGVTRVVPMSQASSSKNMFDLQYQLRLHDLYDVTSTSMIYYKTIMQHLDMLDMELNAKPNISFNRFTNKLYLDIKWSTDATIGQYVLVDGYSALDPDGYPKLWNEPWLKEYVTALFKRQWGAVLKKFGGLQLPGGVTLDGQGVYDEAISEIKDLEEELITKSSPLNFFLG